MSKPNSKPNPFAVDHPNVTAGEALVMAALSREHSKLADGSYRSETLRRHFEEAAQELLGEGSQAILNRRGEVATDSHFLQTAADISEHVQHQLEIAHTIDAPKKKPK